MPDWGAVIARELQSAGHAVDADVVEELAQHAAAAYEAALGDVGAAEAEARTNTLIRMWVADGERLKRRARRAAAPAPPPESGSWLTGLGHDVRYAMRLIARTPGPAAVAIVTMAIGVAAATVLFSVAWGVLVKPLPWPDADRLILPEETRQGATRRIPRIITNGTYLAWSEAPATIETLAAYSTRTVTLSGAGDPQRVRIADATASLFAVTRATALRGSLFNAPDEDAANVIVLSHRLWQRSFSGRDDIAGRTIQLNGKAHVITGVMPSGFAFPDPDTEAWVPFKVLPPVIPGGSRIQTFTAIARLKPGSTPLQAADEATARARSAPDGGMALTAMFGSAGEAQVTAKPLLEALTSDVRDGLFVLLAAVGLLLATATANIAGVQLARAATRRREMAVRSALGAGGARLARQTLVENLLMGLAGGGLGLALAVMLERSLPSVLPADFPRTWDIAVGVPVFLFALGVTLVTSLVFGMVPALQATRVNLVVSLTAGASSGSVFGRSRTSRARTLIMGLQVAVACLLLVGASLLIRSFVNMTAVDRGYEASNVLTARLASPGGLFTPQRRTAVASAVLEALRARPDVQQAAFTTVLPLGPSDATMTFSIPPRSSAGDPVRITTGIRVVSPGYFETMGIQLLAGRFFSSSDVATSQAVLVVNRAFAEKYAAIGGAGQQVPVSMYGRDAWQVAGVIQNIRTRVGLTEPVQPEMFVVHSQVPTGLGGEPTLVVRTRGNPELLITPLRQIVAQADPSATIESVMTMERRVMESLSRPRLYAFVLGGFAGFALLLAGVGLFGVMSYSVTQRSRELGVRAALGARPRDIVRLVVREGLVITLGGAVAGIWTAVVLAGWLRSFLFGISTYDPVTFVAVPAILLIVAALASFVPARRAAGADPLTVLKTN